MCFEFSKVSSMNWISLHLERRCSELRVLPDSFFSFDEYEESLLILFDNFWLKLDFI